MKREIDQIENTNIDLANCLMLLSSNPIISKNNGRSMNNNSNGEFECKTCKRKFPSFQALGGHRTSHNKKPKLEGEEQLKAEAKTSLTLGNNNNNNKAKMHECSICGQEFSLGQALGGHMRRHRSSQNHGFIIDDHQQQKQQQQQQVVSSMNNNNDDIKLVVAKVPVFKRSNSLRARCLDLNLTPLENDLKVLFGNIAPNNKLHALV
ncbi:hypothetical protein PIB30_059718 [Stylosanthes scabra]|uniref:C2H2-type domain-containing protein n=1 Tax=Stylosanthes scabra TaxID=79078 RepID=A0ABU6YLJ2_9FABA|nr:hypothetical protein [Stylosanthes scabra]